jgi:arabinose-5-phosphate isomerase
MNNLEIQEAAKRVFDIEIGGLLKTKDVLNDTFCEILKTIIDCTGKLVITGMGKPGHIATKLAATFSSLGTPSFFLHPAEAMHGDLGMVSKEDVILAISYSGESDEIVKILPNIKMIGCTIIGITANKKSTLAKFSDILQILPPFEEACSLHLAPTTSTTAELVYGDALAVVISEINGFTKIDFGTFHPAGALGKKLILKVSDLMVKGDDNAIISPDVELKEAIIVMSKKGLGFLTVVDGEHRLLGVVSDGDLRRALEKHQDIYKLRVREIMTVSPKVTSGDELAVNALKFMNDKRITSMPVVNHENTVVGTIRIHEIINAGIVL